MSCLTPTPRRKAVMSLRPHALEPVPEATARVARAAFPKGNPYLTLRDTLGTIFHDDDFAALFPLVGQPGLPPWRLALVTIMQFRDRLLTGSAAALLLDTLLERCRALGLLKARGQQRTDSTHVLAAIRKLNRLELVAETLRATLNDLATVAPDWLQDLAPLAWYERYSKRIEDTRLPREQAQRDAYAHMVGEDGFYLLDALDAPDTPEALRALPIITTLRQTWQRHYERSPGEAAIPDHPAVSRVRFQANRELPPAAEGIESPYDAEARYRHKRDTQWTGYMVHVSETCEPAAPHLLTHVHTTPATVHEAMCTEPIQQALVDKAVPPQEHLVDAAYISAELLVHSQQTHGIDLLGPTRQNASWQTKVDGAYSVDQFTVDWERQEVRCPQGKQAVSWTEYVDRAHKPWIIVQYSRKDCSACPTRASCTRAQHKARGLPLPPQEQYEALQAMRAWYASAEGQRQYAHRAGIEGTLSQGVRAFGLRRTRYWGLEKNPLQHVAIAAGINIHGIVAWREGRPRATTRTSLFAALAPACAIPAGTPPEQTPADLPGPVTSSKSTC